MQLAAISMPRSGTTMAAEESVLRLVLNAAGQECAKLIGSEARLRLRRRGIRQRLAADEEAETAPLRDPDAGTRVLEACSLARGKAEIARSGDGDPAALRREAQDHLAAAGTSLRSVRGVPSLRGEAAGLEAKLTAARTALAQGGPVERAAGLCADAEAAAGRLAARHHAQVSRREHEEERLAVLDECQVTGCGPEETLRRLRELDVD